MKLSLTIALHEFRVMVRRPSYRILTALFPLLALAGILAYSAFQSRGTGTQEPTNLGYVDMAGIVTGFNVQRNTTFQSFSDVAQGQRALLKGEIKGMYVIPPDYPTTGRVVKYTTSSGLNMSRTANEPLEEFLLANILGSDRPEWAHERLRTPALVSQVQLDEAGAPAPGVHPANAFFYFALGIILIVSIFMSSGFLLSGIGEEKENRVMEILLSSVTPGQLMIGKVLGLGGAGLLQTAVWVVAGRGLLSLAAQRITPMANIPLPGPAALLGIPYFILGFLLFATLMAGLGAVTTTAREGQQMSGLFVVPAIVPYYAFPYIVGHPDGLVARFLTFFPLTSPITVMERLGTSSIAPWEIVVSVLILAASCAAAMWAVARLFRAYLLMYGKRPGMREVWQALHRQ